MGSINQRRDGDADAGQPAPGEGNNERRMAACKIRWWTTPDLVSVEAAESG
jgi:hypothetical protein